jgi:hypothetical protein
MQQQSSIIPWLALGLSSASFIFSVILAWRSTLSPYSLLVMPPAFTQANDDGPSIIVHLAVTNRGARAAVLNDIVLRTLVQGKPTPVTLHAQRIMEAKMKFSSLPLSEDRGYSVFLPILVRRDEWVNVDLYCAPFEHQFPLNEETVLIRLTHTNTTYCDWA